MPQTADLSCRTGKCRVTLSRMDRIPWPGVACLSVRPIKLRSYLDSSRSGRVVRFPQHAMDAVLGLWTCLRMSSPNQGRNGFRFGRWGRIGKEALRRNLFRSA